MLALESSSGWLNVYKYLFLFNVTRRRRRNTHQNKTWNSINTKAFTLVRVLIFLAAPRSTSQPPPQEENENIGCMRIVEKVFYLWKRHKGGLAQFLSVVVRTYMKISCGSVESWQHVEGVDFPYSEHRILLFAFAVSSMFAAKVPHTREINKRV